MAARLSKSGTSRRLEESLLVHRGDSIVLTSSLDPADNTSVGTHRIGCTLAGVLADTRTGERIWFDDGKVGGVITAVGPGELTARITSAAPQGTRLRAEKGINLPDSRLTIPALTEQDIADLEHVREHADIVGMSFVRSAADVRDLLARLDPGRTGTWTLCSRSRPWRPSMRCPISSWNA